MTITSPTADRPFSTRLLGFALAAPPLAAAVLWLHFEIWIRTATITADNNLAGVLPIFLLLQVYLPVWILGLILAAVFAATARTATAKSAAALTMAVLHLGLTASFLPMIYFGWPLLLVTLPVAAAVLLYPPYVLWRDARNASIL